MQSARENHGAVYGVCDGFVHSLYRHPAVIDDEFLSLFIAFDFVSDSVGRHISLREKGNTQRRVREACARATFFKCILSYFALHMG